jgi:hypothetical protein
LGLVDFGVGRVWGGLSLGLVEFGIG